MHPNKNANSPQRTNTALPRREGVFESDSGIGWRASQDGAFGSGSLPASDEVTVNEQYRHESYPQDREVTGSRICTRLPLLGPRCILRVMSLRPVRKLVGIGNVFLGTQVLDIAEYDLEIYEENPEDHEHHGANWTPNAKKIEGTVVGELPIRQDLMLVTEEGYALSFYLRDSFGSIVILGPMLDSTGKPAC